jgi:biotin operon repressor
MLNIEKSMPNPYDRYTKFAAEYANGGFIAPKRYLNKSEQQTIDIHALLSDGNWHTANEISELTQISKRTVHNVMRSLTTPFAIASGQQGYCIPQKHTILIA